MRDKIEGWSYSIFLLGGSAPDPLFTGLPGQSKTRFRNSANTSISVLFPDMLSFRDWNNIYIKAALRNFRFISFTISQPGPTLEQWRTQERRQRGYTIYNAPSSPELVYNLTIYRVQPWLFHQEAAQIPLSSNALTGNKGYGFRNAPGTTGVRNGSLVVFPFTIFRTPLMATGGPVWTVDTPCTLVTTGVTVRIMQERK